MKNIFVRGKPGSGKTTLIMKVVQSLKNKTAREPVLTTGGFYTQEMREERERTGFRIITLHGKNAILSSVRFKEGPRVGKYRVDTPVIDTLIVDSIEEAIRDKDIVVIDEIGKMEMFSQYFRATVKKALDSPKKVLASIPVYSNTFLDSLTSRRDIEILNLDMDNRDMLLEDILKKLV
ncbi:MAG: NTPase [Thermodesulfovibrionia bacterium]|nr:NTPase [Thermodesulfovibrionia bacterium]MCK5511462.1 NTPase [Thermodesulfovibrionia bacterium]